MSVPCSVFWRKTAHHMHCLSARPLYISSENLAIVRTKPVVPVPASLVAAVAT